MGNKTQTSTSQQTSTPVNQAALQNIYNQVQGAASTPYTPYSGELTAGINGQQTAGINTINSAANSAQPYYSQAGTLASGAANPLTAAQIAQYQNPYTQSVVNATQAQFNDQNGQQQNSLKGTAAQQGALGGDRQAVAQAQLAGQQQTAQAPVIAGLYSNSYNSGLQTAAQQYQQNPLAAASALTGIGTSTENAGLAGGAAQLAAGTQQQQTQQAADTANYGQYQAQQANPYQNAAFLEQYGLPSALGQGSSSSGTQTSPGPNPLAQYGGLGVAAAGLFLKDGGRVGFYTGGSPGYVNSKAGYIDSGAGYIPTGQASQNTLQAPQLQFAKQQQPAANPLSGTGSGSLSGLGSSLKNDFGSVSFGGGSMLSGDAWGGDASNPLDGLSASDYGYSVGGLVDAIHHIHKTIKRSRGGAVTSPFEAYADGGDTSFDDRFSPADDTPFSDMSRGQAIKFLANQNDATLAPRSIPGGEPAPGDSPVINPDTPFRLDPAATREWRAGVDQPNPALVADSGMPNADGAAPNPMTAPQSAGLPPQITNPDSAPDAEPSSALAYNGNNPMQTPIGANGQPTVIAPVEKPSEQQFGHSLFGANISDKTRQALVAAGLGMMASRSPFALTALGEGGLQGLKSYSESNKAEQEAQDKAVTQNQNQTRIEQEAQRIAQGASQFAKTNDLAERKFKVDQDTGKYVPAGSIVVGDQVHPAVMDQRSGQLMDAVTGKPPAADAKIEAKGSGFLSEEDAAAAARRYVATGDRTQIQGLARSPADQAKLMRAVNAEQKAKGLSDQDMGSLTAEWEGRKAGQRVLGTQEAKMGSAAFEAEGAIKQARGVIERLPRTSFLPFNKLIEGYQKNTLNPDQAELAGRTQAIINTYSAVMARGASVTTDSARGHAEALLNTAGNPETFNRMLDTMLSEINMAKNSPEKMREFYRQQYGNKAIEGGNNTTTTTTQSGGFTPPAGAIPRTANGKTYYYDPATKQPYPGQ